MLYEVVVTSTVLIIGVFCLRRLTMGKINMRLRYGLWLLVAVRLLLPVSVGTSALSVMNLMPETFREKAQAFSTGGAGTQEISVDDGRDLTPAGGKDDVFSDRQYTGAGMETAGGQAKEGVGFTLAAGEAEQAETKLEGKTTGKNGAVSKAGGTPLSKLLAALWFLGFFAVGGYMLFESQRFVRYLHRNRRELPAERLPDEFAQRLAKRNMRVYQVTGLPGPCLVARHIYIGEGAAAKEQNLTHVLAHEYCHALHGDRFWAFCDARWRRSTGLTLLCGRQLMRQNRTASLPATRRQSGCSGSRAALLTAGPFWRFWRAAAAENAQACPL